jgi:hypothetical protein
VHFTNNKIQCVCQDCGCRNNSFVWINHDYKFIWFEIPKNASSTFRYTLGQKGHRQKLINRLNLSPDEAVGKYPDYFSFAFLRNPKKRIESNFRMFTGGDYRKKQLKATFPVGTDIDNLDYQSFIKLAEQYPNHHWNPQTVYLPTDLGNVSYIGNLECFSVHWQRIQNKLGIQLSIVLKNQTLKSNSKGDDQLEDNLIGFDKEVL